MGRLKAALVLNGGKTHNDLNLYSNNELRVITEIIGIVNLTHGNIYLEVN